MSWKPSTLSYPDIVHSGTWSDIHRPFKNLVSSDPGNNAFIYQRTAPLPPQKFDGNNNSVSRSINSDIQKKSDYKCLKAINFYIANVRVENLQKFCCTHVKFLQFPTSIRLVTVYMSAHLVYIELKKSSVTIPVSSFSGNHL